MKFLKDYVFPSAIGFAVWLAVMVFTFVLVMPFVVMAEEGVVAQPPDVSSFIQAIGAKNWPLAAAFGVTLLVWGVRFYTKDRVPIRYMRYILLACTILSAGAGRVIQAVQMNHTWWIAAIQGIPEGATTGLVAMGLWSSGGRDVLPSPKRE